MVSLRKRGPKDTAVEGLDDHMHPFLRGARSAPPRLLTACILPPQQWSLSSRKQRKRRSRRRRRRPKRQRFDEFWFFFFPIESHRPRRSPRSVHILIPGNPMLAGEGLCFGEPIQGDTSEVRSHDPRPFPLAEYCIASHCRSMQPNHWQLVQT